MKKLVKESLTDALNETVYVRIYRKHPKVIVFAKPYFKDLYHEDDKFIEGEMTSTKFDRLYRFLEINNIDAQKVMSWHGN